jgi:hypothetical protein
LDSGLFFVLGCFSVRVGMVGAVFCYYLLCWGMLVGMVWGWFTHGELIFFMCSLSFFKDSIRVWSCFFGAFVLLLFFVVFLVVAVGVWGVVVVVVAVMFCFCCW